MTLIVKQEPMTPIVRDLDSSNKLEFETLHFDATLSSVAIIGRDFYFNEKLVITIIAFVNRNLLKGITPDKDQINDPYQWTVSAYSPGCKK